ncbi:MAG: hypothetical protein QOG73_2100, partial [Acetobacteraceae bacterium]|nr:hypothetical protein [Acetobacteraceae bacterium]
TTGNNTLSDGGINALGQAGDTLKGGTATDTYSVANSTDVIVDTGGTDTVNATALSYNLNANASTVENLNFIGTGAFTGTGNGLANVITGGAGADTLSGGIGNDTLIGNVGNDNLTGGTGDDNFTFNAKAFGADIITDFRKVGDLDLIDVSGLGIKLGDFNSIGKLSVAVVGGSSVITVLGGGANGGTITLSGFNKVVAADFHFAP